MKSNAIVGIMARLGFLVVWFLFGWIFSKDTETGIGWAITAFVLMEIFYQIDRKTRGIDTVLSRLDVFEETVEGAQDTQRLLIEEITIASDNLKDSSEFGKGQKAGLELAEEIVNKRFAQLFEVLQDKNLKG